MTSTLRHTFAALVAACFLFLAYGSAHSYEVFLDHNTDGDITTFENLVVGPVSAPIDIVVQLDPSEPIIHATITWEMGEANPKGGACADFFGSVDYVPWEPLPNSFPFMNVVAFTCVCITAPCICDATVTIEAYVIGLTEPGLYRLATLDFSRVGMNQDCGSTTWSTATFTTGSAEPQGTLVITAAPTGTGDDAENRSWGGVKALYR